MRGIMFFLTASALVILLRAEAAPTVPPDFDKFFLDKTLRIDYHHTGHATEELIGLDRLYWQKIWAGSCTRLLNDGLGGRYASRVYDAASGQLLFSRGFDCYFAEYQSTAAAGRGVRRTYHESAMIPFPKAKIRFSIEKRDRQNCLQPLFSLEIDPAAATIVPCPVPPEIQVFHVVVGKDPHHSVDLAVLGEGYTAAETAKFQADLDRLVKIFFRQEPYSRYQRNFNVYGVLYPSRDSGISEPSHGVFKDTALGAGFDSLGLDRYVLTEENRALRNIAGAVPCDTVMIMMNHSRYGGGGIYNSFCTFTSDNQWFPYLLLHEFGHSFSGLADEYYTSTVAFNDFYPAGVEPLEPNITALLDPANLKWKESVSNGVEIPTPWEKKAYDEMDLAYQQERQQIAAQIARMKKEGAPPAELKAIEEKSEQLSLAAAQKADAFLRQSKFRGKTGAYQGAGYSSQGLYRPALDCLMFSKGTKPLCPVCRHAVEQVIKRYIE